VLIGVNFGNIYCRTTALGNLKSSKPDFMTWEEYTVFLLESIGLYNSDLMLHYYRKITKFMTWYKKRDDIDVPDIPEEADTKLESGKKVISWRRIARAIEKNDFYMKRLSFAQTKTDDEELRRLIHKWDNLLTEDTVSDDKDLNRFINKEVKKDDFKDN
jgi:predicted phosphoadenosine phosphosulfate sulfurtransferase